MKQTDSNEWVKLEGKIATVGITKHASQEFKEIVFVELPQVGKKVAQGEEAVILESTKAAADSYAPVSGKVVRINEKVLQNPSLIVSDPHGEGWLYQLEVTSLDEFSLLPDYEP